MILPFCTKAAGTRIDKVVVVLDFRDTNYKAIASDKNIMRYVLICAEVGASYPDILGQ